MTGENVIATKEDLQTEALNTKTKQFASTPLELIERQPLSSAQPAQQTKPSEQKTENPDKELKDLAKSEKILLTIKTVFPFTLFPDMVIITEEKITLRHKVFFYSESIRSILIKDVVNVEAQIDIFFGKLEIVDRYFAQIPLTVSFLRRKDALKAREIIQGLITSDRQEIDLTNADTQILKDNLQKIGQTSD